MHKSHTIGYSYSTLQFYGKKPSERIPSAQLIKAHIIILILGKKVFESVKSLENGEREGFLLIRSACAGDGSPIQWGELDDDPKSEPSQSGFPHSPTSVPAAAATVAASTAAPAPAAAAAPSPPVLGFSLPSPLRKCSHPVCFAPSQVCFRFLIQVYCRLG